MNSSFLHHETRKLGPKIPIQKDSRPSEFSRPLTSITLNLNGDLPVDLRRHVSLLKLPNFHYDPSREQISYYNNATNLKRLLKHVNKWTGSSLNE